MPIEIVRKQTIRYGEHGEESSSDHLYVNLSGAIEPLLQKLKGCPLSFILAIGLHESKVILKGEEPLSISAISEATGYSRRAVIYAADLLTSLNYVTEIRGKYGQRLFRPAGIVWFGGKRHAKIAHPDEQAPICAAPEGYAKSDATYAKNDAKGMQEGMQSPDVVVVKNVLEKQASGNTKKQQQQQAEAKQILRECGVVGKVLGSLSEKVSPETAKAWCAWLDNPPSYLRNPVGVMISTLKADSEALPPKGKTSAKPKPYIRTKLLND